MCTLKMNFEGLNENFTNKVIYQFYLIGASNLKKIDSDNYEMSFESYDQKKIENLIQLLELCDGGNYSLDNSK